MDVNSVKAAGNPMPVYSTQNTQATVGSVVTQDNSDAKTNVSVSSSGTVDSASTKKKVENVLSAQEAYIEATKNLNRDDIMKISRELNHFMELLNADIQFSLHEKSQRLVVQVVDMNQHRVLKEFPPHELLDTMAKIRDYVGVLLDKKV